MTALKMADVFRQFTILKAPDQRSESDWNLKVLTTVGTGCLKRCVCVCSFTSSGAQMPNSLLLYNLAAESLVLLIDVSFYIPCKL